MTAEGICGRGCGGIMPGIGAGIMGGAAIGGAAIGGGAMPTCSTIRRNSAISTRVFGGMGVIVLAGTRAPLITMPLALPSSMIETPVGSMRTRQ
jgi:hypothetical protein